MYLGKMVGAQYENNRNASTIAYMQRDYFPNK